MNNIVQRNVAYIFRHVLAEDLLRDFGFAKLFITIVIANHALVDALSRVVYTAFSVFGTNTYRTAMAILQTSDQQALLDRVKKPCIIFRCIAALCCMPHNRALADYFQIELVFSF